MATDTKDTAVNSRFMCQCTLNISHLLRTRVVPSSNLRQTLYPGRFSCFFSIRPVKFWDSALKWMTASFHILCHSSYTINQAFFHISIYS